jgi:hypothetical protein
LWICASAASASPSSRVAAWAPSPAGSVSASCWRKGSRSSRLLDEPATGLDAEAKERIAAVLAEESARGVTIVHATHDPDDAADADHRIALSHGRLLSDITGLRFVVSLAVHSTAASVPLVIAPARVL